VFSFTRSDQLARVLADLAANPRPENADEARARRSLREQAKLVLATLEPRGGA
jgi:hypothetical protein